MEMSETNADETQASSEVDTKVCSFRLVTDLIGFLIFFFNVFCFIQTIKCSSCTDDAPATSWCVECAEYICDSCVQAHQRLKITKDHTIKSKEEALADNQSTPNDEKTLMCHIHPQVKSGIFHFFSSINERHIQNK